MTDLTSPPGAELFERLKAETQPWHDRLEADLDVLRVDFDRDEYVSLLERFFGFCQPWEQRTRLEIHQIPGLANRCHKNESLREDLRFFGWTDEQIDGIAKCEDLPSTQSLAAILGSFYVLEGATLGGQIIARHLVPKFGLQNGGCRFFTAYGSETGKKWKELHHLAEEHCRPHEYDRVIASARNTFSCMHDWLCRKSQPPQ